MKPYIVFEADKLSAKELERRLNWFEANNYEVFEHGYDRGRFVMKHYEPPPPPPRMLSKQEREELGNKIVNWAHEKEIKLAKRHIIYYLTLESTELNPLDFDFLWAYIDTIKKKASRK